MSVPATRGSGPVEERAERFTYFMLRIRRPEELPDDSVSGLVEQLATGEKRSFASMEELIRIIRRWLDAYRMIEQELPNSKADGTP
jgi:hypothetical protein